MTIRRRAAAKPPAIGEARIDCSIERDDITGKTVGDRDRSVQVDGPDNIDSRPLQRSHSGWRKSQSLVDTECIDVANQHREQDIVAEVRHIRERARVKVQRLTLCPDEDGIEQGQSITADLYDLAESFETGDNVAGINHLNRMAVDARTHS